jgi:hypothetical protein
MPLLQFPVAPGGAIGLSSAAVSRLGPGAVLSARSPGYQVGEFSLRLSDRGRPALDPV